MNENGVLERLKFVKNLISRSIQFLLNLKLILNHEIIHVHATTCNTVNITYAYS